MQDLKQFKSINYARELFVQLPIIVFAVILFSGLSVGILSESFDVSGLWFWFAYMVVVGLGRLVTGYFFFKSKTKKHKPVYWLKLFAMGTVFSSLGIGYFFYTYFDPGQSSVSLYMVMLFSAYIASNTASTGFHIPIYLMSAIPVTLGFLARLVVEDYSAYSGIMLTVSMLFIAMLTFAKRVRDRFVKSVEWAHNRVKLEGELRKRTDQAEELSQMAKNDAAEKTKFIASISHDLKQPLHAIGLFHDSLRLRLKDPENIEVLDKASRSTQSLNEMLLGMLDISKLDADKMANNPAAFEVRDALNTIHEEFSERAAEKGLELRWNIESGWYVFLDRILLARLVRNLIDNAIKYTNEGFVEVSLTKAYNSLYYELHISDSGHGIPKNKLTEVFMEFSQLNNPERTRQKGLGLGLTVVKKMCHLMGLEIRLDSEVGHGTMVTLDLPVAKVDLDIKVKVEPKLANRIGNTESTVLLIEDNDQVLDAMTMLLESLNFTVLQSTNTAQALALFLDYDPRLVISDFRLPGDMDGLTLLKKLQGMSGDHLSAILVTGETSVENLQLSTDSGLKVLHKPVNADTLEAAINEVMTKNSQKKESIITGRENAS